MHELLVFMALTASINFISTTLEPIFSLVENLVQCFRFRYVGGRLWIYVSMYNIYDKYGIYISNTQRYYTVHLYYMMMCADRSSEPAAACSSM